MEINISDKQIEGMLKDAINKRVQAWFSSPDRKYFMRDTTVKAVQDVIEQKIDETGIDIPKCVATLSSEALAKDITNAIGEDIARYFIDKYDY